MRRRLLLPLAAFLLAFAAFVAMLALRGASAGDDFDFLRWEISTTPNKWLYALGAPFRSDPPADEAVQRYFALDDRDSAEGRELENTVEATIEGRVDAVLRELDVDWPLNPLGVWPPVDIELAGSPRVLVVSPRERIERVDTHTLRPDLTTAEAEVLEAATEADREDESALVVGTGGMSTYPAIVSNRDSYAGTVDTAAHEWAHHYLSVYPLGREYFGSEEARIINETVADFVGDEVSRIILERWPALPEPAQPSQSTQPAPEPTSQPAPAIDFDAVMRDLRTEVDALLTAGRVEDAERRMEEVRQQLADGGINIRRINQAYFAWYGTYAARPDSVDPLGSQLREVRERAGSLREFMTLVRDATSRDDVARLVASLGG